MAKLRGIYRENNINYEMIKTLVKEKLEPGQIKVFPTIRELMCFAATLGYSMNKRDKLPNSGKEDINVAQWQANASEEFIYLIGLADRKNTSVLEDENKDPDDDINLIFEEYANAGLNKIKQWMNEYPQDPDGYEAIIKGLIKEKFLKIDLEKEVEEEPIF
jgi:dnd system-associated protein 4